MKHFIFYSSFLALFIFSSCNNQPAKRQNPEETADLTSEKSTLSDYQETPVVETKDIENPMKKPDDSKVVRLDQSGGDNDVLYKTGVSSEMEDVPTYTPAEIEQRRAAALERRRKKDEAQRERAIARAKKTGDVATIRAETNRVNTADIKATLKSKDELMPEQTREQLEQLKKDYKNTIPEKTGNQTMEPEQSSTSEAARPVVDHSDWDYLLRKYVSKTGKVDYKGLKSDRKAFEKYLKQLRNFPPDKSWSRNEKMAYWINAYNAFTIKLILDNYPLSSITNLDGGKPWDKAWIKLGTETYTLNNIENNILRPVYKDPRIHFAVNCAAASCPPLLNRAWTAENLERQFQNQTRAFINNSQYNNISANKVEVSKIFDWYGEDFEDLIGFLNKYSHTKINSGAQVTYREYDWSLNE